MVGGLHTNLTFFELLFQIMCRSTELFCLGMIFVTWIIQCLLLKWPPRMFCNPTINRSSHEAHALLHTRTTHRAAATRENGVDRRDHVCWESEVAKYFNHWCEMVERAVKRVLVTFKSWRKRVRWERRVGCGVRKPWRQPHSASLGTCRVT